MRAPEFWSGRGVASSLLLPAAWLYTAAVRWRFNRTAPWRAPVPVLCVGNITAGGAGKTPLAIALAGTLAARGFKPAFLTRGYRGSLVGPVAVDPRTHDYRQVGDEPLLLARHAPTWVARDRCAGARAAAGAGADVVVMDDGFQNPALYKDLSLLAIDGGYGFGNGRVHPAGPLREPVADALARADAAVVIGDDRAGVMAALEAAETLRARYEPTPEAERLAGKRVVAFAGIGRPDKFFDTLSEIGATVVEALPYPDHHPFKAEDVMLACEIAAEREAVPVTTEKDFVRLPEDGRSMVEVAPVRLVFERPAEVERMLDRL